MKKFEVDAKYEDYLFLKKVTMDELSKMQDIIYEKCEKKLSKRVVSDLTKKEVKDWLFEYMFNVKDAKLSFGEYVDSIINQKK